jgi:hypothetical protein
MSVDVLQSTPPSAINGRGAGVGKFAETENSAVTETPARPLRMLLVHNAYQHRGGEDMVADAELELLTAHGHEVREYRQDNEAIRRLDRFSMLRHTLWSPQTVGEITELIRTFAPDVIHAHNTFALISPSVYCARKRRFYAMKPFARIVSGDCHGAAWCTNAIAARRSNPRGW